MRRLTTLAIVALVASCAAGKDSAAGGTPVTSASSGEPDPSSVVASWEGGQITYGELDEQVGVQLQTMEVEYLMNRYDTQTQALDALVRDALIEAEAEARGVTVEELMIAEIEQKAAAPTEEQVLEFYEQNAQRMGGASLEEAQPFIEMQLTQQNQGMRFREWYAELTAAKSVEMALTYPDLPKIEVPIDENDPTFGEADAPITIVQFAEYECYYCARALPTVDRVLEEYDGQVKLVFKDFPLGFHERARPAAIAAHCAGEQDKYWDMNHLLLGNQQDLSDAAFLAHAETAGMDVESFQACLTSGRYDAIIAADMETAQAVGVSATPTFFVDGIMISGAQPFERFAAIIDRALEEGT